MNDVARFLPRTKMSENCVCLTQQTKTFLIHHQRRANYGTQATPGSVTHFNWPATTSYK